jgi:hypothetical protein
MWTPQKTSLYRSIISRIRYLNIQKQLTSLSVLTRRVLCLFFVRSLTPTLRKSERECVVHLCVAHTCMLCTYMHTYMRTLCMYVWMYVYTHLCTYMCSKLPLSQFKVWCACALNCLSLSALFLTLCVSSPPTFCLTISLSHSLSLCLSLSPSLYLCVSMLQGRWVLFCRAGRYLASCRFSSRWCRLFRSALLLECLNM